MKTVILDTRNKAIAIICCLIMTFSLIGSFVQLPTSATVALADDPFQSVNVDGSTAGGNVSVDVGGNGDTVDFANISDRYKNICSFVLGIFTITMILFMVLQFTKLGAAGDNAQARSKAIAGILTTGIAAALLGSASIWFGFFYNAVGGTGTGG